MTTIDLRSTRGTLRLARNGGTATIRPFVGAGPVGPASTVPGPTGPQGPIGPQGPQGLPGPNSVPADTAVAGYVSGSSATQTAADARYAQSSAVSLRPAGTSPGAARLPFINVKDYLAAGNNSTDDTAAIQAAIDAATAFNSNMGAIVYLPPGIYRTSASLNLKSRVILQGAGRASSRIRLLNGANCNIIQLADGRQYETGIRDLTLDGNKTNQVGTWHGISYANDSFTVGVFASGFANPHHHMDNLFITYCSGDGLVMAGDSFGGENHISNVFSYSNLRYGFNITTPDSFFDRLSAGSNGESGFRLNAANSRFVNCKAWYSGQVVPANGDGFYISGTTRMQFSNCEAQDNTHHGWYLSTVTHSMFAGCTADSNGTSGTGAGWFLTNSANLNSLFVIAYDRQTPVTQTAHMQFDGTCSSNVIDLVGGPGAAGIVGTIGDNELRYRRSSGGSSKHRIASAVEFGADNTYDIGITSFRPRDLLLARNALIGGGLQTALKYVTSGVYTATTSDSVLMAGTGATGVQLPTPAGISGRQFKVKNLTSGALPITSATGNVENVASYSLAVNAGTTFISDGTNYFIV